MQESAETNSAGASPVGGRVHVRSTRGVRVGAAVAVTFWVLMVAGTWFLTDIPGSLRALAPAAGIAMVIGAVMLMHGSRRRLARRARAADNLLCPRCHYPLEGLGESGACPECGQAFEVDEVRRAWTRYQ